MIKRSRKEVKAVKKYKCRGCGQFILPGKLHIHEKYLDLDYGKWIHNRYHSITCEFELIDRQFEAQQLYDHLEAHYKVNDCIYTTKAISPMTEEVNQYDDEDY